MPSSQMVNRTSRLSVGAFALVSVALTLGTALAHADPNDPALSELSPDGHVRSEQAAKVEGGDRCVPNEGTLGTASIRTPEIGVPEQTAKEAGPEWVGSRGWQAVGIDPADPWGGNFDPQNTPTGPACAPVAPSGFS
ncbi:MAG: hypothetical protein ACXWZL_03510 [Mycobacterium sp.]